MKKWMIGVLVFVCLWAPAVHAVETVDYLEHKVAVINGGQNATGAQAEYLCKHFNIDTRDQEGNLVWNCRSRAALLVRRLTENGYVCRTQSKQVFSTTADGNKDAGDWHEYVEVKVEQNWLYNILGVNGWVPCLDVWSIAKASQ